MGVLDRVRAAKIVKTSPAPKTAPQPEGVSVEDALATFGHTSFRDGQKEVVDSVLEGERGVLVVCPTGWGKSLTYQVPALVLGKLTIVVSPLISLMKDQVDKLQQKGVPTAFLNSSVTPAEQREIVSEVFSGGVQLLYVAPERFSNRDFNTLLDGLQISLFVIDEAHCISRWGHDFRPAYSALGDAIKRFQPKQVMALTATATTEVQDDICKNLGFPDGRRFVRGLFRDNLEIGIIGGLGNSRPATMTKVIKGLIDEEGVDTGIIYTITRKDAESICKYLQRAGVDAIFYHAGLKDKERIAAQNEWSDNGGIVVATTAFGMGIDKADVRFVFHYGLPSTIEDWYQQIGRAGRDGKPSSCIMFWDGYDYTMQKNLIQRVNPSSQDVGQFWSWLRGVALKESEEGDETVLLQMTQKVMSEDSGTINVGGCISFLKKRNLVKTLGRGKYSVSLAETNFDASKLDEQLREQTEKLETMMRFIRSRDCRVAHICKYFGDESFDGSCGICDNCK